MSQHSTILGGGLDWEQAKAAGREWANVKPAKPLPNILDVIAGLPQINSRRIASDLLRELAGRGLEIREIER